MSSWLIATAGSYSLFLSTALIHAGMAFYAFTRIRLMQPAPLEMREVFTPVPQGSPASLPLDPRGPAQENLL